jgi:methionine synthase II (cobalamin-independent)
MVDVSWPWLAGSATGVGSLPGTDVVDAAKLVFGELPDLPHLPELPARGPGADLVGRGAALLTGFAVELYAGRWRITARPGRDLRRTVDLLDRDLDALTAAGQGYTGLVKIQAAGPWTLAASLELPGGSRVLRDHGAVRDLTESIVEGLSAHVADVHRRLPGARVMLQLDEPSLPVVLAGQVPTESGLYNLAPVEAITAESALRSAVEAVGVPVVIHCCAPDVPVALLAATGAAAVSLDLGLLGEGRAELDAIGDALEAGVGLFAGVVPTMAPSPSAPPPRGADIAATVTALWRRLGFPDDRLAGQVVVTPACGLAGATPEYARAALAATVEAGRRLADGVAG